MLCGKKRDVWYLRRQVLCDDFLEQLTIPVQAFEWLFRVLPPEAGEININFQLRTKVNSKNSQVQKLSAQ